MTDYETKISQYEAKLIYAQDKYFTARPQIIRTIESEKIFEAGFRLAFKEFSDLRSLIESNIKDMPPEFSKAIDDNFWDLAT